jgi:hypothetical protein
MKLNQYTEHLVNREIYYNVSYLVDQLTKAAQITNKLDISEDDVYTLNSRQEYAENVEYGILNDLDMSQLEEIADEHGSWSDILEQIGVPDEVATTTDWVCDDCLQYLVNGELPPDTNNDPEASEDRDHEIEGGHLTRKNYAHTGEVTLARLVCDNCGVHLLGNYHGMNDGDMSDDLDDRLAAIEETHPHAESKIRDAVLNLVRKNDAWQKVAEEYDIEPENVDVYEHWLVSDWFGERLRRKGETVVEILGMTIWGRTCTGQSISMDYVIEQIAKDTWIPEIDYAVEQIAKEECVKEECVL